MTLPEFDTVLYDLAKIDDIPLTAQHMRASECWLPGLVWRLPAFTPAAPGTDWESIAESLARVLESFTAYDGYGQGGAEASNLGDWRGADEALAAYYGAKS